MARKKKAPPAPDPREAPDKVLCDVCGANVLEDRTEDFLDPAEGMPKRRCFDCRDRIAEGRPSVEETSAPEETAAPSSVEIERNSLVSLLCSLQLPGLPSERERSYESAVETIKYAGKLGDSFQRQAEKTRQIEMALEDAKAARTLVSDLESRSAEARDLTLRALIERLSDLEILLGFSAPADEQFVNTTKPWMLQIAAELAKAAPAVLDERRLSMLLVDAITEAFAARTVEAATTLTELKTAPAGGPLLEMERAVRRVLHTLAYHPQEPASERQEAIVAAWESLNLHTRPARAGVEAEVLRLVNLVRLEHLQKQAVVPTVQDARPIVVKRAPLPDLEAMEDEDAEGF